MSSSQERSAPREFDAVDGVSSWATGSGFNPSPRGRISQVIKQAYDAAHG
ncbi:Lsr2 family protein [Arthrobacter oryzae]|uniref:Lsr2 DNA-binding domain-containing protein n=1 Tax=Arthrobacter oryzae TaxID=409290 RepID=A0A3N0C260_9MICC|nr:Lsr2 family protein [Arthrobacter oryzae]RNL56339.1 hypothetical protein D7003_08885 [Arthrobacter oryzae]